ncbi:MAG: hypothetical protein SGARI_004180, partial [Bacillariaceae sp.]
KRYHPPLGWARYGLGVVTGVPDEDEWIHPFNTRKNWWRAYHGTKNAGKYMDGVDTSDETQMENAAIDSVANIISNGFKMANVARYGDGVYCSPKPASSKLEHYIPSAKVRFEGETEDRVFEFMLQVAVRPGQDTLTADSTNTIWAVQNPDNIRPYGLLLREMDV